LIINSCNSRISRDDIFVAWRQTTRWICIARPRVQECHCIKVNTAGRSELAPSLGHMIFLENLLKYFISLNADKMNPY
jgi:hypothetical protein